jgi:mRNA-degrading endonuclease RelE of RelBE toxin-antitoxin system
VNSHRTESFDEGFKRLPKEIKRQAREAFKLFQDNPRHPSLQFKKIRGTKNTYSARITDDYRVLGTREKDDVTWYWIGPHSEYDKMIKKRPSR